MEKHIQLAGILNLVYRGLGLILGLVLMILSAGIGHFLRSFAYHRYYDRYEIPPDAAINLVSIVLVIVGIVIFLVSVVGIVAAIGLLKRKEWGRILLLVVSFMNLLHIPIGTALGVYTIWVLMKNDTIRLFTPSLPAPSPPSPPPVGSISPG